MLLRFAPLALAVLLLTPAARAAEIDVMSGGAPKGALAVLIPRFEALTGHRVKMTYRVISTLKRDLADGAKPDMVLLPAPAVDELVGNGTLRGRGRATLGTVGLVAIVGRGRPLPDIATPDAFRARLLEAGSIVYSTPTATPSGAHMARVVVELGIAEAIGNKVTYKPALEGGAALVAAGKAEIGIYPSSEVVGIDGVVSAGSLPAALQLDITYAAAITAANPAAEPAAALIRFLAEPGNKPVWRAAGFDPS